MDTIFIHFECQISWLIQFRADAFGPALIFSNINIRTKFWTGSSLVRKSGFTSITYAEKEVGLSSMSFVGSAELCNFTTKKLYFVSGGIALLTRYSFYK